ncbi:MAG: tRNA 4-thiouridine(8) synthase ThiI [Lentisphaeria bacterium]|nr:tRNA 4-thiouridine(8) synthase ThiI [Lentisphaeria bacterium]
MYNCIICRYHEIATKGNNRNMFERCLVDNIRRLLKGIVDCKVLRVRGRIWIEHPEKRNYTQEEVENMIPALEKAFGIETFSPAMRVDSDMEAIRKTVISMVPRVFEGRPDTVTFRVRARRSNKSFPLQSKEIEIDLVSAVASCFDHRRFKLNLNDDAELTLGCEVRDEFSLLYFDTYEGPGGLPVGSNPRVMTLLSGGIDSPVAAYLIMKRGSPTDYVSFHSFPYTPEETTEKVKTIAAHLNTFQQAGKLHLVNLLEFQKAVRDNCSERLRTVLYRRAMLRIAERIASETGCRALVTGDALGQVASQTLVNMDTINRAIDMLVLRPVVGEDKLDTIATARKIGTMELSENQVPDSCTVFAPSSPSTSVPLVIAEKEELLIPGYAEIIDRIVASREII